MGSSQPLKCDIGGGSDETPQSILEVKNFNTFVLIILTEPPPSLFSTFRWNPHWVFHICFPEMLRIGVAFWIFARVMQNVAYHGRWKMNETDCRHNATVIHTAAEACCYSQRIDQKAVWEVQNLSQSC